MITVAMGGHHMVKTTDAQCLQIRHDLRRSFSIITGINEQGGAVRADDQRRVSLLDINMMDFERQGCVAICIRVRRNGGRGGVRRCCISGIGRRGEGIGDDGEVR